MIAAFLLAAAATAPLPTAIDAERAFAADSHRIGMWTAFRKYAHADGVMFTPQAVWARDFLKDRKDPPKSIDWWPLHSFVSCDGRTAVNTGPWVNAEGKSGGYFTTVWQREKGNWRWVYDGGGPSTGQPAVKRRAQAHRASCRPGAPGAPIKAPPQLTAKEARSTPDDTGRGQSADRTLGWEWKVDKNGARKLRVYQWNGLRYAQVLFNDVPAPPAQ